MVLEVTYNGTTLITPSFLCELMIFIIITLIRCVVSCTCSNVSEPSVHHSLIDRKVDDELLLTVINSCELSLIRLSLDNLYLLDHLCRKVLRRELRVIKEECLSIDGDLGDGLTVCCDRSV